MSDQKLKLTCLIAAYNEAPRIGHVLDVVSECEAIGRVVVIDDCSRDETFEVASKYPNIEVHKNEKNLGKTKTIARGLSMINEGYVLFLDADLIGLDSHDLNKLIDPVEDKSAEWSISLRGNSPFLWRWIGLDYISGERVVPRQLFDGRIDELNSLPKFGLEVFMNRLAIKEGMRLAVVRWPNVSSPYKASKQGFWKGLVSEFKMLGDIFKVISPIKIVKQIYEMKKLKTKD